MTGWSSWSRIVHRWLASAAPVGQCVHRTSLTRLTADGHRPTADSPKRAACSLLRVTGSSIMLYAWMQTVMSAVAEMERVGFRADRHLAVFKPERSREWTTV
jgi:hypothetical protein